MNDIKAISSKQFQKKSQSELNVDRPRTSENMNK